jgi:NADH:ubiquinone oxidoreductase subunit E
MVHRSLDSQVVGLLTILHGESRMSVDSIVTDTNAQIENHAEGKPFDLQPLDQILKKYEGQKGVVIPILQDIQEAYGFLPREILAITSKKTRIPLSQLYGVATFYAQFHLKRRGRHLVRICDGTACHVSGAAKIVQAIENAFTMEAGSSSPDFKYTLEIVYCVGSCGLAPVAVVNGKVYAQAKPEPFVRTLKKME